MSQGSENGQKVTHFFHVVEHNLNSTFSVQPLRRYPISLVLRQVLLGQNIQKRKGLSFSSTCK